MKTKYRKINFEAGQSLESVIKELKGHKDLVCGMFNGIMLYSDVDDMDSAYKKITGKTKAEFDEAERIRRDEYKAEKERHEESIPELTKLWIEKGKAILDQKYIETWEKCVPIRLSDIYRGMELVATLDIVKELNAGCELEVAKGIIEGQEHSWMSFNLVRSMVKTFCDRGNEFVNYIRS
jgi:hypothetical protein